MKYVRGYVGSMNITGCLGVDVNGLDAVDGRRLELLYGSETANVEHGGFVRGSGFEVKVFSTNPGFVSPGLDGRRYSDTTARD